MNEERALLSRSFSLCYEFSGKPNQYGHALWRSFGSGGLLTKAARLGRKIMPTRTDDGIWHFSAMMEVFIASYALQVSNGQAIPDL